MFQRNVLLPSSGSKNKASKKPDPEILRSSERSVKFTRLHCVTLEHRVFSVFTAVRISDPTQDLLCR
jgi:hypothetical protein